MCRRAFANKHSADPMLEMMESVVAVGGEASASQREFIDTLRAALMSPPNEGTW